MTIKQMIERQQQILSAARAAGRNMTAEEVSEFENLQRSIDAARAAAPSGVSASAANPNQAAEGQAQQREGESGSGAEDPLSVQQRAVAAERARIQTITTMAEEFGMDARSYIENGTTEDQMRAHVIEHLRANGSPVGTGVRIVESEEDKYRAAASDALLQRASITPENPAPGSRDLMGLSLKSLAIECMIRDGMGTQDLYRKNADDIYQMAVRGFYNPESSFPAILDQTIEKAYREGHKKVSVTFDKFTKKGTLSDFKVHDNYYISGPAGEFYEVPENGELKHDVFGDEKLPQRQLKTYGRQFTLSRKAFIDDDIGLVTRIPAKYAAAARRTINKQVFQILLKNAAIYDGAALFSSVHKNLLKTGTGVTQAAMQTMMMAMADQKDQFGESIIINPKTILVPSGMQFDIYTLFNSPVIETSDNTQAVNPLYQYRSQLEVVEDPTINAMCGGMGNVMPWFLFGNPEDCDGIEVDYLNGQEIPNIRRMEAPGQLGFIWDIYLDWGISVMDYRSMVKNPGVKVETKLELA